MIQRKTLGTVIIGVAITLAIALLPLLIYGDDPITGTAVGPPYNVQLEGNNLFISLLFIGLSIVTLVALKDTWKPLKLVVYPTLFGVICGIILGILIPIKQRNIYLVFEFNMTLCLVIFGLGVFISLIALGIYLQKNKNSDEAIYCSCWK